MDQLMTFLPGKQDEYASSLVFVLVILNVKYLGLCVPLGDGW